MGEQFGSTRRIPASEMRDQLNGVIGYELPAMLTHPVSRLTS